MKSKSHSWINLHDKRFMAFTVAVILIALVFVGVIISILSGNTRPFADVNSTAPKKMTFQTTLQNGSLKYSAVTTGKSINLNSLNFTIKALVRGTFSLQGVNSNIKQITQLSGGITVMKQNGDINNPTDTIIRHGVWVTSDKADDSHAVLTIDSDVLRDAVDALDPTTTYRVILKPDNYLATEIDNIGNLRSLPEFPQSPAGDFTNDNAINGADFATIVAHYGEKVDDANRKFDLNLDGTINGGDFAIMVANYGKSGVAY